MEGCDVPDMFERPVDLSGIEVHREGISARSRFGRKWHDSGLALASSFKVLCDRWVGKAAG